PAARELRSENGGVECRKDDSTGSGKPALPSFTKGTNSGLHSLPRAAWHPEEGSGQAARGFAVSGRGRREPLAVLPPTGHTREQQTRQTEHQRGRLGRVMWRRRRGRWRWGIDDRQRTHINTGADAAGVADAGWTGRRIGAEADRVNVVAQGQRPRRR